MQAASPDQARATLIEIVKKKHPYFKRLNLVDTLHPKQQKFYYDEAPLKAALCSRRAGKSRTAAVAMVEKARKHPGSLVPYIALTRQSAQNIMWPAIAEMNRQLFLGLEMKESSLEVVIPTKGEPSKIFMVGADQKNFIERLRGPKYPLAVIDEAGQFRSHIEELVEDVLEPAVSDYRGQIWLLGTPGAISAGYFFDVTSDSSKGFSTHHWTLLDNPYMPHAKEFLEDLKQRKNWTEDHPTYQREWLGKWAYDPSSLVYRINDYNICESADESIDWNYVLGIDIGWHDQTAFSVLAYSVDSPITYVVHCEGHSELIPSEIADYAKMMIENYQPTNVVMDTGGLGKSIAEEFRRRFNLPIEAADKKQKMATIELMNGDLRTNQLRIFSENLDLIEQMRTLQKADNGLEDPSQPNDLADATLYSWRKCKQYAYSGEKYRVDINSNEWADKWAEQYEQKLMSQQQELEAMPLLDDLMN